jgi:hypothetical protein
MAYSIPELVSLFNSLPNDDLKFKLYNTLAHSSNFGEEMTRGGLGGTFDAALRQSMGSNNLTNFVNRMSTAQGTASNGMAGFDPTQANAIPGWDPAKWAGIGHQWDNELQGWAAGGASPGGSPGGAPAATPGAVPGAAPGGIHTLGSGNPSNGFPAGGPPTSGYGAPPPGGSGGGLPGGAPGGGLPAGGGDLEGNARRILGTFFKSKPDGTPDWNAMSDAGFFNTLPEAQRRAMVDAHLGASIRDHLNMSLLPGQSVPGAAGGSTGPGTSGAGGNTLPTASAATWRAPQPTGYTAPTRTPTTPYATPERPAYTKTPFDFFNDEGYKFRKEQGTEGIQNSAAARGGLQSGATLKSLAKFNSGLAADEMGAAYGRYNQDRNFTEGQYTGDRNFGRGVYEGDRNFTEGQYTGDRAYGRGAYEWDTNDALRRSTSERDYNNSNRQWDYTANEGQRRDARDFDFTASRDARDYTTNLALNNRNFGYNAQTGDRTYQTNTLMDLARMGLGSAGASGNLASELARLLGSNTLTGAGAGAAGTVGGANNLNQTISQLLQFLQGRSTVKDPH